MQNRFKSKVLWLAVAGLIAFVLKNYFGIVIIGFDELINMILGIAVMLGIVNNPTSKYKL